MCVIYLLEEFEGHGKRVVYIVLNIVVTAKITNLLAVYVCNLIYREITL